MGNTGTITTHDSGVDLLVEWQIQRFSTLSQSDGSWYESPAFSFGGERWSLGIYPNGRSVYDSSGFVGLVLFKCPSGRSINVSFSLSLKTVKGERHREEHCTKDFNDDRGNWVHRFDRFIPRSELTTLRSALLPDDVLTVVCTMKRVTSAGRDSDSASAEISNSDSESDSAEISNSDSESDSAEISAPASDSAGCSSDSGKCRHCSGNFAAGILSFHQRKCEKRPVKCPDCSEFVVLQKFLNEHECQPESPEGATSTVECPHCKLTLEAASLPTHEKSCVDRPIKCPQCGEDVATKEWLKHKCLTARTNDYNCREKILMALCIASIIIAVVTGCVLAHSKTPLSPSHPGREAVTKIETSEINNTINGSELDGSLSNEIGDIDIKQTEGVNKAAEVTLTTELNAELNKTNQSEIAKSVTPEASVANQADSAETGVSEGASKIQTSVNNRSDAVGSNGFEALTSNETSSTDIKKDEGINKTLAAEMNETDKSEIAASDISETSATNQAHSAQKDESDLNLPKDHDKQLVFYAAAIIILVIAIACVYHYSKTSLSATHAYEKETQTVSEEDDSIIEAAVSEEADTESEASDSNTCMSETESSGDNLKQNSENTFMVLYTQMAEENEERDWMTDVLDFLKAGNCIDVTFEVETPNGHVEFFAHKLILAMKSPFFADEFYGERKSDAHLVIPLKGINPRAFMETLRYCYDNKPRMRTIEDACVLYKLASDFKMMNLQKLCHAFIRDA